MEKMNKWIDQWYEENERRVFSLMHEIWGYAETGLTEEKSCRAAGRFLEKEGFSVELRCAQDYDNADAVPNSVIAAWGSGSPVIAFVGELDCLPGLNQEPVPYRCGNGGPGHGCGHNLMSGGAAGAGAALKYVMEKEGLSGTVKVIEAPAEELGCGKMYLAKNGVFKGLDLALMWHPYHCNFTFAPFRQLVVYDADFEFHGKTSHASGSPWLGRSALDAVQLMNLGCEFMREHMVPDCRIHYNITNGGQAANVVPEFASVHYMFRAKDDMEMVKDLYDRGCNAAKGAALMTGTTVDIRLRSVIPKFYMNEPLCRHMYEASQKIPPLAYTQEEYAFGREIYKNAVGKEPPKEDLDLLPVQIDPYDGSDWPGAMCTDAAEMSYFCPTIHFLGGVRPIGTFSHHWMVTSLAGMSIGEKAGLYAYKILTQGAYDALMNPEIIRECWAEFEAQNIPEYHPAV